MRLAPRSLFGQLVLVLLCGLMVAQLISGLLHLDEQVQATFRASGLQAARRIAAALDVFDRLPRRERTQIAIAFAGPQFRVRLNAPDATAADLGHSPSPHALMFTRMLRRLVGSDRALAVFDVTQSAQRAKPPGQARSGMGHEAMMRIHMAEGGPRFRVASVLADGQPVTFEYRYPEEAISMPLRLLGVLATLLLSVVVVSLLAVRWITRPLSRLANAAEALGHDVRRPPLDERGPVEVSRAARAFNTMQQRIVRYIDQRTRLLAALSHDLKTPITRLRLRNEFVHPAELREKFATDLKEMEQMVGATLELLRGAGGDGHRQPVDLQALLETIQRDALEHHPHVSLSGHIAQPVLADPVALKRCFENLVGNALRYANKVWIELADRGSDVTVVIEDDGPGIPNEERVRVFEPFYRIEGSRSRETGGTGLGLAIARDVIEAQHGSIQLDDSTRGGLRVLVVIPR